jgi:hypothetical protein
MTVYTNTARFDGTARPMTEDEIRAVAPSVFAVTAHSSRSEKFMPIPTIEVVRGLAKEGFSVVGASQSVARIADRKFFTKHLLRIRRIDETVTFKTGDTIPEMMLKNANDGTGAYDLMSALYRISCLNSMVAWLNTLSSFKVRHSGKDVAAKVIEGTFSVIDQSRKALAAPEAWSSIQLNSEEQHIFATAAHQVRFGEQIEGEAPVSAIMPTQLLTPRRWEDRSNDLWTTFNRVQENAIKGGLAGQRVNDNGVLRRSTTRQIKGVDQNVNLNKALFTLANAMAELRGVKIAA